MDWERIYLKETDSTNRYVKELAVKGAAEGTVVIANRQTAGRGRLGRSFFSPEEKGIYMSILLRPKIELQRSVLITSMAAVAVARAIEHVSGIPAQIKWVNDIFLNKKKVCGILTEAGINAEEGKFDYAVLGIGINVGIMEFPEELKEIATSVCNECGRNVNKELLIEAVLKELDYWYPTIADGSFLEESRKHSILLGKEIRVVDSLLEDGGYFATAVGIDDMGYLLVEKDGSIITLNSGEVSIRF